MEIQYFKAQKATKRFNENQKIWVKNEHDNHLTIKFKWRGKGSWANGTIDKFAKSVGKIETIPVTDKFFCFVNGNY